MKRREFITVLGGAATWPLIAHAQQPAVPVVGFLHSAFPEPYANLVETFRQTLRETGYTEGRTLAIEYRWAEGRYNRLPVMAADLVSRQVAVIAATGGSAAALAAKEATATIPIVFATGGDPVKLGLVSSLNRPNGNVTGVSFFTNVLEAKRLQLLHEIVPHRATIGFLINPTNPASTSEMREAQEGAHALGVQLHVLSASSESDIDTAFASLSEQKTGALLVGADPFLFSRRDRLVALAARHKVPAIYTLREYALSGGLMSYGTDFADVYRQTGIYIARILKGALPADIPVTQSTKFNLVINLKTTKALGLTIPPGVLAIADEVIE